MVLHKYGDMLYKGLQQVVDEHLKGVAEQKVVAANDDQFLTQLRYVWNDHKVSMLMIRDILMYMVRRGAGGRTRRVALTTRLQDCVYVVHQSLPTVYELGLQLFRDNVTRNPRIKDRLLKMILFLVHKERTGEVIDRSLLKAITQMQVDLGVNGRTVYEEDFERPFLESSALFYRVESQEFISSNSCADYMKKVDNRLKEELNRVNHYQDASTEPKIREVVERELITVHMKTLIEVRRLAPLCGRSHALCRWSTRVSSRCFATTSWRISRGCTICLGESRTATVSCAR